MVGQGWGEGLGADDTPFGWRGKGEGTSNETSFFLLPCFSFVGVCLRFGRGEPKERDERERERSIGFVNEK